MAIAQTHQSRLKDIKSKILDSYVYFEKNREYYNTTRKFVLKTNITPQLQSELEKLSRPVLQFNALEAYVSRQLGEFAKQVPGIEVSSEPSEKMPNPAEVSFVENYMRGVIKDLDSYSIYRDSLTGGFSCIKVWTEYENSHSFNQKICAGRVYDPLLVGFDSAAQKSHKGDGSYCFEIIPLTEDQFRELYPNEDIENCFNGAMEGFRWGYTAGKKRIILVCDFYEKRTRKVKLYRLSDNRSRTKKQYEEILAQYENKFEQAPSIIDERISDIPYVCRYRLTSESVLEYKESDFCGLPLIFVDGNSVLVRREGANSDIEEISKAYVHNALDSQRLRNVSGQTIANEIESMVQHKMKIALESIPTGYEKAYRNPQKASNYIYKAYKDGTDTPLPAPQEVVKMPLPPEVLNTFMGSDQLIQSALGSYDATMGINKADISGKAIIEGATQSNAAAMPYIVNYLAAIEQMANIILDLIPKYLITPRSVPIVTPEGKREHVSINDPNDPKSLKIQYTPSDLKITMKPGVNFDVQKNRALMTLEGLSQAFPSINQMLNENGLPIIFDNLDIKGADQLKVMAEEFTQQQKAQKEQMMKMQQQGQMQNPEMMKLQLENQKAQAKDQNEKAELGLKQQEVNIKQQEADIKQQTANLQGVMAQVDAINKRLDSIVELKKNETERQVHGLNAAITKEENDRKHVMNVAGHNHKVSKEAFDSALSLNAQQNQQQNEAQKNSAAQDNE